MDFTLSKQQQMVQKMYREFAENEVKPLAKKVDAEEYFPKETVEKMGKLGMMGIYFPTDQRTKTSLPRNLKKQQKIWEK